MYILDKDNHKPLYMQLYEQLKKDIIENYKIGEKIPSVRKMTAFYNLSKTTVESAYSQLVAEGYIESYPNSGYRVEDIKEIMFETRNTNFNLENNTNKENYLYNFHPVRLSSDLFPLKLWKKLFTKYINSDLDFGKYSNSQGEHGLRSEIAKYLKVSRAVNCHEDQIIIGSGFSDSMGLLAKIFKKLNYNSLAIENPGYYVAKEVFENFNFIINKISIDSNGIKIDELKQSKSNIVYITPSHQYPTGVTIPIFNRYKLLNWAKNNNSFIIEDDYDTELNYINRPIPSLQGLDNENRVVYIGTFSKSLSATLRISYIVLPYNLLYIYQESFKKFHVSVSLMTQKVLEKFISEGHWDKHLRKMRTINRRKHNLMKYHLLKELGNTVKIETQGGGLSILINPTVDINLNKLKELASEKRIKLYFAKDVSGGDWDAIRMGFGGFDEKEIPKAIELFSIIWFESIIK